jgi:hypothetical protein
MVIVHQPGNELFVFVQARRQGRLIVRVNWCGWVAGYGFALRDSVA